MATVLHPLYHIVMRRMMVSQVMAVQNTNRVSAWLTVNDLQDDEIDTATLQGSAQLNVPLPASMYATPGMLSKNGAVPSAIGDGTILNEILTFIDDNPQLITFIETLLMSFLGVAAMDVKALLVAIKNGDTKAILAAFTVKVTGIPQEAGK